MVGTSKAIGLQELTNVSLEAERWSPPTSFTMEQTLESTQGIKVKGLQEKVLETKN